MGLLSLRLVVFRSQVGMGLDPGHGLGARVGHVALQRCLHRLGSHWTAHDGIGPVIFYVHWREPLQLPCPSSQFDYKQHNDHQQDAAG